MGSTKKHTGYCNTGDRNTGYCNTGYYNTGDRNTGNCNTGNWNTGNCNTGYYNTGYCNTGDRNTGYCNTGYCNTGNCNTGDRNTGYCNTGYCNTGDRNTGNCNTGNWNTGWFNIDEPNMRFFGKDSPLAYSSFIIGDACPSFVQFALTDWVSASEMSSEEKKANPGYETCGGYLKKYSYHEAWANFWSITSEENRKKFLALPNFNAAIFKKITGIDVETKTCEGKVVEIDGKKYKLVEA